MLLMMRKVLPRLRVEGGPAFCRRFVLPVAVALLLAPLMTGCGGSLARLYRPMSAERIGSCSPTLSVLSPEEFGMLRIECPCIRSGTPTDTPTPQDPTDTPTPTDTPMPTVESVRDWPTAKPSPPPIPPRLANTPSPDPSTCTATPEEPTATPTPTLGFAPPIRDCAVTLARPKNMDDISTSGDYRWACECRKAELIKNDEAFLLVVECDGDTTAFLVAPESDMDDRDDWDPTEYFAECDCSDRSFESKEFVWSVGVVAVESKELLGELADLVGTHKCSPIPDYQVESARELVKRIPGAASVSGAWFRSAQKPNPGPTEPTREPTPTCPPSPTPTPE